MAFSNAKPLPMRDDDSNSDETATKPANKPEKPSPQSPMTYQQGFTTGAS